MEAVEHPGACGPCLTACPARPHPPLPPQIIALIAIECSNCANLTSASRMMYAFSRDGGLPCSGFFYNIDKRVGGPVRAIWFVVLASFALALPSLGSNTVLSALFSLTATGLYSSYLIPVFLRLTVGRASFTPSSWSLGRFSLPAAAVSVAWCVFMTAVLCLLLSCGCA